MPAPQGLRSPCAWALLVWGPESGLCMHGGLGLDEPDSQAAETSPALVPLSFSVLLLCPLSANSAMVSVSCARIPPKLPLCARRSRW